jgi:hypothetical protein
MAFFGYIQKKFKSLIRLIYLHSPGNRSEVTKLRQAYLNTLDLGKYQNLIVFLVPGIDLVTGGVMSIISIAEESRKLYAGSTTGVFVCPLPGEPPLAKFTKFDNDETVVDYRYLVSRCPNAKHLLLHIPEIYVGQVVRRPQVFLRRFRGHIQFNVLLQNIDLAPSVSEVAALKQLGLTTITTAHKAYSGQDTSLKYDCPVLHLSVWASPEKFHRVLFDDKKKLIIVSPDKYGKRDEVLRALQAKLPDYKFLVIQNMPYRTYLATIAQAQFSLTFGEGLDGYFVEPVFSGGVGGAVFNSRFFSDDYRDLPFVYDSWDEVIKNFADDVKQTAASRESYLAAHNRQFAILSQHYRYQDYLDNIRDFYHRYFFSTGPQ